MLNLYTNDVFEDFLEDPKCNVCGSKATQRCSRCKNVWYASRECQLKDWKAHKPMCDVFVKNMKDDKVRESLKNERAQQVAADKAKYNKSKIPGDNYKGFKGNPKVQEL